MATVNPTITNNHDHTVRTYHYANMTTTDDVGAPFSMPTHSDKHIQVIPTAWGTGGTLTFEGSNKDGASADGDFDAISALDSTTERAQLIDTSLVNRPHVTAGDGSTDVDVYITVTRRTQARQ